MPLNDWTVYRDGGGGPTAIAFTDIVNPIVGSGSVTMTHDPGNQFQSISLSPNTLPTGFTSGRMRTLIRLDDIDGVSGQENHFGILTMQSAADMAQFGTSNQSYAASISIGEGGTPQSIRLWKLNEGLDGSSGNLNVAQVLDSVAPPFTISQGQVVGLEFQWRTDSIVTSQLGGAELIVRVGQQINFSDLQQVIGFIDTLSPYTSTVGESIFAGFKNSFSTDDKRVTFDNTSVFRTTFP